MWFKNYPERWEIEQESLLHNNVDFTINEALVEKGFFHLNVHIKADSDVHGIPEEYLPLDLIVVFHSLYPYFRPEIYALRINLPRHQNIVNKNLCMLPRATVHWSPETLLIDYIKQQLPRVFREGLVTNPEILQSIDGEQAEPVSEYYPDVPYASMIFDVNPFDSIDASGISIELLGSAQIGLPGDATLPTRMMVLKSFDINQELLYEMPSQFLDLFHPRAEATIFRLAERPPYADARKDYAWILQQLKSQNLKLPNQKPIKLKGNQTLEGIIGITFPEERSAGQFSWGWLFIIIRTSHSSLREIKNNPIKYGKQYYYAKVNRWGENELAFRIPSMKPIQSQVVAVFGLGALGAPSVIEFAKNGIGEIRIIDFDTVNAGTIVRWPLGVTSVGMFKTDALENFIKNNYPHIKVKKFNWRLGSSDIETQSDGSYKVWSLEDVLSDVSLIYDATAETGVTHFLAEESRKRGIPLISIYGTPGVWGGAVMRYIPNLTEGCWMCFQHNLYDGLIPSPPAKQEGIVQAAGCGDLSFTGASFELDNIVSAGVRLAVSTMCLGEDGYPNLPSDIGILSLVDDYGNPIFPKWTSHKLEKNSKCPYCNKDTDE